MDLSTATFGDSSNRCPFPRCPKPSLCRTHRDLVPESLLDEYDMRHITNYFKIRFRLHDLITADAPSSSGGSSEAAPPSRHLPEVDSAALEVKGSNTHSPSRVAASSIRTICMYCKTLIRDGEQKKPLSHGVCEPCLDRETAKLEVSA